MHRAIQVQSLKIIKDQEVRFKTADNKYSINTKQNMDDGYGVFDHPTLQRFGREDPRTIMGNHDGPEKRALKNLDI